MMYGADVERLRSLAAQFERFSQQLDTNRLAVGNAIQISAWVGPFAVSFRLRWESDLSVKVGNAAHRLHDAAGDLRRNADDQERASAETTGFSSGAHAWSGATVVNRKGPHGVADMLGENAGMTHSEDGIRIEKIRGDDGKYRYVVYVDGSGSTRDGAWGGDMSWQNNVAMMANADNETMDHVRAKIASAIDDPDAEVAIIGFSQGGLIAQKLADECNFNVRAIVTYGSPNLTALNNYGGADVIRLEHNSDLVPGLDMFDMPQELGTRLGQALGGYSGPAKGEEVVFRAGGPVINLGTAGAHNQADYRWVAEQFDKSSDSNYDAAKSRLSHFYGTVVVDDNTDAR